MRSRAPIPPLLHTCGESRDVLRRHGYQLCFGTRSAPPRTWFCPRDDVLYLSCRFGYGEASQVLDGGNFNVGQFLPEDLRKVRRLALDGISDTLSTEDTISRAR